MAFTLSERIVNSVGTGEDPTELTALDAVGATIASGTTVANITDAVAIAGGESPTEAEHNALVTKINLIIAALEAFDISAS